MQDQFAEDKIKSKGANNLLKKCNRTHGHWLLKKKKTTNDHFLFQMMIWKNIHRKIHTGSLRKEERINHYKFQ